MDWKRTRKQLIELGISKERLPDEWQSGIDLSGASLRGVDLGGAYLREVNLSGADLYGADLHRADLSGADLRGADLRMVSTSRIKLYEADLTGAIVFPGWHLQPAPASAL